MEIKQAVSALGALAQDTRLELFRLLVRQGPAGLPAGELAQRLAIPPATLSFHLGQLSHAGLVTSRRDGRSIIYAADYVGMRALLVFLTEHCCQPDDQTSAALAPVAPLSLDRRPTPRARAGRATQKGPRDEQRSHRRQGR